MAPVARRTAAAPPPVSEGVNFGDLGMYAAGGGIAEGDYALEFTAQMFQAVKQNGVASGPPRLGVMITAHSLVDPAAEPKTAFLSMGANADKSFAPNPDTGKGLVAVPGAQGTTLNNSTNWFHFMKSMYDCGLPVGIFSNDLTVLDGVHVHLTNIPEPEERKGFGQSKTGETQVEERQNRTMPIVSEIKEDGKPWEGTGGFEIAAPAAAPKVAPKKVAPKAPAAAASRVAFTAPVAVEEAAAQGEEEVLSAAVQATSSILEKSPAGVTKLLMRTGTFKAVNEAAGADMAQAVIDTFFGSDADLNGLMNQLGYGVAGTSIKPLA